MEELQFLKTVIDEATKALAAAGYKNIEFFDDNLVPMNGSSGKNIDDEETVARKLKPTGEDDIILTLSFEGEGKYTIVVTIDNVNFEKFDNVAGDMLKRLAGKWGAKLNYRLDTWGGEIKHKDDREGIKKQIQGNGMMDTQLAEAKTTMTGTTRSSYQKVGECKVIIRHSGRVNEEKFGARSRNINSIFIETKGGERFKMAENNLHGARAMARHLSNNGSPFDTVGVKITTMMNEMKQLREMAIEARNFGKRTALTEEQSTVIFEIKERYVGLRENLKKMSGKVGYMKHTASIQESEKMKVETETKAAKNKKEKDTVLNDQAPVYDRPTDGKDKLVRDADDLFSVNENKYGTAPEEVMLESWFNEEFDAEFYKEEELVIEDSTPTIKKTLPENALGMLNMYMGHPLFDHYMRLYEEQEILDKVLSMIEEDSKLWESVTASRGTLNEFFDSAAATDFDKALTRVNALISDRRLSLENAINQISDEIVGENQDIEARNGVAEKIWGMAEESGLIKHDFGSTFSDQVLAPNETVSAHDAEIDAEEYYGDAMFAENMEEPQEDRPEEEDAYIKDNTCGDDFDHGQFDEMNQIRKNAGLPLTVRESKACSCGCDDCGDDCKCATDCDCGCSSLKEGDPFARQSKRNLKNPKARMSLINPEDKIGHGMKGLGEDDVEEGRKHGVADWVGQRERTQMDRIDRGGEKGYKPRSDVNPDDKYTKMARDANVTGKETHKKVRGIRENEKYVEVDMPHHLPETEKPSGEATLSKDGARIIELSRYRS